MTRAKRYCKDCGIRLKGHGKPERCRSCASKERWRDPKRKKRLSDALKSNWCKGIYDRVVYVCVSDYEHLVMDALDQLDIEYISQYRFEGTALCFDLMLPGYNQIIEVDGRRHRRSKIIYEDVEKDALAESEGYDVWRITNEQAESANLIDLLREELL